MLEFMFFSVFLLLEQVLSHIFVLQVVDSILQAFPCDVHILISKLIDFALGQECHHECFCDVDVDIDKVAGDEQGHEENT